MKAKLCLIGAIVVLVPNVLNAAICPKGWWLDNGVCTECGMAQGFYCPGDDGITPCPADTTDWDSVLGDVSYSLGGIGTWDIDVDPDDVIGDPIDCHRYAFVSVPAGNYSYLGYYNGYDYSGNGAICWEKANVGYYLIGWYGVCGKDALACTNAPAHAHYTTAGTYDNNDCEWECDCGYKKSPSNTCEPVASCAAGIGTLRVGSTSGFKIYAEKTTDPSLVIQYNNQNCYVCLGNGSGQNALNIRYGDATYHTTQ